MTPESIKGPSAISAASADKKAKPEEEKKRVDSQSSEDEGRSKEVQEAARNDRGVQTLTEA